MESNLVGGGGGKKTASYSVVKKTSTMYLKPLHKFSGSMIDRWFVKWTRSFSLDIKVDGRVGEK